MTNNNPNIIVKNIQNIFTEHKKNNDENIVNLDNSESLHHDIFNILEAGLTPRMDFILENDDAHVNNFQTAQKFYSKPILQDKTKEELEKINKETPAVSNNDLKKIHRQIINQYNLIRENISKLQKNNTEYLYSPQFNLKYEYMNAYPKEMLFNNCFDGILAGNSLAALLPSLSRVKFMPTNGGYIAQSYDGIYYYDKDNNGFIIETGEIIVFEYNKTNYIGIIKDFIFESHKKTFNTKFYENINFNAIKGIIIASENNIDFFNSLIGNINYNINFPEDLDIDSSIKLLNQLENLLIDNK